MACVSTCLIISPRLTPNSNFSSKKKSLIRLRSPLDHHLFPRLVRNRVSSTRHGVSSARAASSYKFSGCVESDRIPKDVKKRAMKAVDECDLRVRVDDVASKGGLTVTEAQKALQALAADTNGFLEMSNEGDVLYVIPKDYRSKSDAKWYPFLKKAKVVVPYLICGILCTVIIGGIIYAIFISMMIKLLHSARVL